MKRSNAVVLVALAAAPAFGCVGQIEREPAGETTTDPRSPGQTGKPSSPGSPTSGGGIDPRIDPQHGALGLRRLTGFEYANTVGDLLGIEMTGIEAGIPEDEKVAFLSNNQHAGRVGLSDLEAYERLTETIAVRAAPKLALACQPESVSPACLSRFLGDFLRRAFRRPPQMAEIARYAALHARLVQAGSTPLEATAGMLQSILLSPSFLYRSEIGDGRTLSAWEAASRLSYFVWGTLPDAELFARAEDGSLAKPAERDRQLRRLLADARAHRGIVNIVFEWFGLNGAQLARKGREVLAGLPANLQPAIEAESRRFVVDALLGEAGSYESLYTARSSYLNDAVAAVYGVSGVMGTELRRTDLDPRTRRGLFTQPLVFVAHAKESGYSVVQMGRFVRERLLCQEVPPPPPGTDTAIDETPAKANLTYRQKIDEHATNVACRGCHMILDPPGFAFLSYDPVGRHEPLDPAGRPLDTTGTLIHLDGGAATFTDAVTMLDAVASSQEARACFARKFIEYAFGRTLAREDVPLWQRLTTKLSEKAPFAAVLGELASSAQFTLRGPGEER